MIDDSVLVKALEAAPAVTVPDDFAARVMARVPAKTLRRTKRNGIIHVRASLGVRLAWVSMMAVLLAMIWIASQTHGAGVWLWVQALLFSEFGALVLWSSSRKAPL